MLLKKIKSSLDEQVRRRVQEESLNKPVQEGFSYRVVKTEGVLGEKTPRQIYEIEYPQFENQESESVKELNVIIQSEVLDNLVSARHIYYDVLKDLTDAERENFIQADFSIYVKIHFTKLNDRFASYLVYESSYSGGAHGLYGDTGYNYFLNPLRNFFFRDLFDNYEKVLISLRELVFSKLEKMAREVYHESEPNIIASFEQLKPIHDDFKNYCFKENSIVFIYNPYHLTPWMMGSQAVEISFDELRFLFPNEQKLQKFIQAVTI